MGSTSVDNVVKVFTYIAELFMCTLQYYFQIYKLHGIGKTMLISYFKCIALQINILFICLQAKLHTFPLHRISYCADDKSDKKICAFIAKEDTTDTHICFVMESEKAVSE